MQTPLEIFFVLLAIVVGASLMKRRKGGGGALQCQINARKVSLHP